MLKIKIVGPIEKSIPNQKHTKLKQKICPKRKKKNTFKSKLE
jgi:hypothetical protein